MESLREILRTDVLLGAQALLGCNLVRGNRIAQIVETEAYTWDDPGCHAYKRERMKNMAMYGEAGLAYIYFTYGNHWMLNVVADKDSVPGAVLIRAAMPISGVDEFRLGRPKIKKDSDLMSGPGRLAKAFDIDSRLNGIDLLNEASELKIISTPHRPKIRVTPRIGIAIGKGDDLPRRFIDEELIQWATKHKLNKPIFRDTQGE